MIKVYGSSDDLIEIESDNKEEFPSEEFLTYEESNVVAFSDGTLLEVRFDRWGVWRIAPLERGPNFQSVTYTDDGSSDIALIEGRFIKWVVLSKEEIRP